MTIKEWDIPIWRIKRQLIGSLIIDIDGAEMTVLRWDDDGVKMFIVSASYETDGEEVLPLLVAHEFETYKIDKAIKKAVEILEQELKGEG